MIDFKNKNFLLEEAVKIDFLITEFANNKLKFSRDDLKDIISYGLSRITKCYLLYNNLSLPELTEKINKFTDYNSLFSYFTDWAKNFKIEELFQTRLKLRRDQLILDEILFIDKHIEAIAFTMNLSKQQIVWDVDWEKINSQEIVLDSWYVLNKSHLIIIDRLEKFYLTKLQFCEKDIPPLSNPDSYRVTLLEKTNNKSIEDYSNNDELFILRNSIINLNIELITSLKPVVVDLRVDDLRYLEVEKSFWYSNYGEYSNELERVIINTNKILHDHVIAKSLLKFIGNGSNQELMAFQSNIFPNYNLWNIDPDELCNIRKDFVLYHEYFHKSSDLEFKSNLNPYKLIDRIEHDNEDMIRKLHSNDLRLNEFLADYFAAQMIKRKYSVDDIVRLIASRYKLSSVDVHKNQMYYSQYENYWDLVFKKLNEKLATTEINENNSSDWMELDWKEIDGEMEE